LKTEKEKAVENVLPILSYSLHQVKVVVSTLPVNRNKAIIENIFNDGLDQSFKKAISGKGEK
jgi:hypothetical protein